MSWKAQAPSPNSAHDSGQPGTEPVRITEPVQSGECVQERFLHDVICVAGTRAEPGRASQRHGPVPLYQQPERSSIPCPG
jgi:hypothetical protein